MHRRRPGSGTAAWSRPSRAALALALALAVAGAAPGCGGGATPAPPAVHNLEEPVATDELTIAQRWAGAIHTDADAPGLEVHAIRDADAYRAFVARLPERRIQMKQPAPPSRDPLRAGPAIDFTRDMLIVAVRAETLQPAEIARVTRDGDRLVVDVVVAPQPPAARPDGVGAYAAVRVPHAGGAVAVATPRLITDAADLADAVGALVTVRGPLSRTRMPTILGVDVDGDGGDAAPEQEAEASGWLEVEVVTQAEIDARIAQSGQYAHRGPGTFYRLRAATGAGLAEARRTW
ncbi:MAG: hypothetical protein H6709_23800 [Kofleriaceae bacterium]|nr:hypothetical protein [Kofleriaceae bacterium]MCB9575111.1 hypothetical protein [Kofleriaceae bacterium]